MTSDNAVGLNINLYHLQLQVCRTVRTQQNTNASLSQETLFTRQMTTAKKCHMLYIKLTQTN